MKSGASEQLPAPRQIFDLSRRPFIDLGRRFVSARKGLASSGDAFVIRRRGFVFSPIGFDDLDASFVDAGRAIEVLGAAFEMFRAELAMFHATFRPSARRFVLTRTHE